MTIITLSSPVCWEITLTLLHVCWVGLLIGLIAVTANCVMRNVAASQRCSVNFVALLMFAMSLPVSFIIVRDRAVAAPELMPVAMNAIEEPTLLNPQVMDTSAQASASASKAGVASDLPPASISSAQSATIPALPVFQKTSSAWSRAGFAARTVAPAIAILYLLGVTLMLLKLVIGARVNRRLRVGCRLVLDTSILSRVTEQAKKLSLRITPVIAYCEHAAVPIVVGLLRPMILIPAAMANCLTIEQLEAVLTHELAHLHRRDHLMILMQRIMEAVLFFHPVTWYLSHHIHDEREASCDDRVLAIGGDRLQYAQSLLRVAELRLATLKRQPAITLAADGQRPSKLRQRIERLLETSDGNSVQVSSAWPIVTLLAVCSIGYWLMCEIVTPAIANETNFHASFSAARDMEQDPVAVDFPPLRLPLKTGADFPQVANGRGLPVGMIQRFGSVQFRSGAAAWQSAVFSADGEWIWCKANGVTVMHRETGHVINGESLGIDKEFGIKSIAMSPGGTVVAVAGIVESVRADEGQVSQNRVVLFNSDSGKKLSTIEWQGASGGVSYLAMSHDESTLLTGDYRGDVRLWNIANRMEIARIAIGLEFKAAAISPNGDRIVLVGSNESLMWSPNEDGPPRLLSPVVRRQLAVSYSPDGRYFATGCWAEKDGFRLWDGRTGEIVAQLVGNGATSHPDGGIAFTPDSKILAVPITSADCVELWDVESRMLLSTLPVIHARAVTISHDGNWLAAVGDSQRVQIFDLNTQAETNADTVGHFNRVSAVRFVNRDRILTSDLDGVTCLWDVQTGEQLFRTEPAGFLTLRSAMAVSPDGKTFVLNPIAEKMTAFDSNSGKPYLSLPGHGPWGESRAIQFARDGKSFVSWGDDQELRRWIVSSGEKMLSGTSLAITVPGYVHDTAVGRKVRKMPQGWFGHEGNSLFVEFEGSLKEFDANDGAVLRQIEVQQLRNLSASPDGRWIATVEDVRLGGDQPQSKISLRDATTLQPIHHWVPGTEASASRTAGSITSQIRAHELSFSPDSARIAWTHSGGASAAEVADVNTKKIVAQIPLPAWGSAIDFSPDGKQLAIGSSDTTIGIWDLSKAEE